MLSFLFLPPSPQLQFPVPSIPSRHEPRPPQIEPLEVGQGVQSAPKRPESQSAQSRPVYPAEQVHPEPLLPSEHVPFPEQATPSVTQISHFLP